MNIEPVYEAESNGDIGAMREKLNIESGVIISNHPGYFDTLVIMNLLKRKDIKIMVAGKTFHPITKILGPEHFLEAVSSNPTQLQKLLKEIKGHIESGGVLLIYPTAGKDSVDNKKDDRDYNFEDGLKFIVEKILRPEDMVYSFWVEPEDVSNILNENVDRMHAVAATSYTGVNVNKFKKRKPLRVKEAYSNAEKWKEVVDGVGKDEAGRVLSDCYLDQFKTKDENEKR